MIEKDSTDYAFETGMYRPPSEGGSHSLLVRFTRNCPWNRCGFCAMYKTEHFSVRPLEEITADIDAMAALCRALARHAHPPGNGGDITHQAVIALLSENPSLNHHPGAAMVINWLQAGARTAFIQDANSLIMKTPDLVAALTYLRQTFPSLTRVTSYGRSHTVARKSADELRRILNAGLNRLHLGMETGDDELLKRIKKGVTADGHIRAGKKALAAGFQLSEYWMPGLGGKALSDAHAVNTAAALNAINPHYIRSRPFRAIPGTPLYDMIGRGEFQPLSPTEQLLELRRMVSSLSVTSRVCFDHAGNFWKNRRGEFLFTHSYEGYKFPEEKDRVLGLIAEGLAVKHAPSGVIPL
jgi:biotin synthase-like enzyme